MFLTLKHALLVGSMLHLTNFNKVFMVDCDASDKGFSIVLHRGEGPLAFFSKLFALRHLKVATYECELTSRAPVEG